MATRVLSKTKTEIIKKENVSVPVLSEVLCLDELSCPQIWNMEKEKGGEKQKAGRQASEAQPGKELERERKSKRKYFLLEEQHEIL